jgi:hypothetical protein
MPGTTRKAHQAERLFAIRLRYCINTHLDEQGLTAAPDIARVVGLPPFEAARLVTRRQWREADVAALQAVAGWLGLEVPLEGFNLLARADRPPLCAVTAVALINRIPYHGLTDSFRTQAQAVGFHSSGSYKGGMRGWEGWPSPAFTALPQEAGSGGEKHATPEEIEATAPEGLPLQHLQFAHLSLHLSAAPCGGERGLHRCAILLQSGGGGGDGGHTAPLGVLEPAFEGGNRRAAPRLGADAATMQEAGEPADTAGKLLPVQACAFARSVLKWFNSPLAKSAWVDSFAGE